MPEQKLNIFFQKDALSYMYYIDKPALIFLVILYKTVHLYFHANSFW